jgi:hypothetical protein
MALVCALVCASACSDANVAGNYTAQLTNGSDGCSLGLTPGATSTASFTVTQSGSDVTLMVKDAAGFFIAVFLGSNTFTGSVDGDDVNLERKGTVPNTAMTCEFTYNAKINASQDGDAMSGRVEYRTATNGVADCGSRQGCVTVQEFNATRPPAAP